MAAKTRDHLTDQLFKAILSLKSEEQCSNFFEDYLHDQRTEIHGAAFGGCQNA